MKYLYLYLIGLVAGIIAGAFIWILPVKANFNSCHFQCGHYNRWHICTDWDWVCPLPPPPPPLVYHSVCRELSCVQVLGEGENACEVDKDCEPVDTISPTPAPPAPQPCNECSGPTAIAPTCTGAPDVTVAPINFFIIRKGVTAEARWVPTGGSEVNLYYKELKATGWTHAVRDAVNNGDIVVGGLNPKLGYTFGLQQRYHCGDGMTVTAVVVDGPGNNIFKTTEYLTW